MKNLFIALFLVAFSFTATAQEKTTVTTVALEQTKGAFTQKELTLKEGTYVFQVSNNNAAPEVGFVLVKAGDDASNPANHIKEAYVTEVVKLGETESTSQVTLAKGTYTYFCPLNHTPQYTLQVE